MGTKNLNNFRFEQKCEDFSFLPLSKIFDFECNCIYHFIENNYYKKTLNFFNNLNKI